MVSWSYCSFKHRNVFQMQNFSQGYCGWLFAGELSQLLSCSMSFPVWEHLIYQEKNRLLEASRCFGIEAYTMCESVCFDALVSILRRIYGGKEELGHYINKIEQYLVSKEEADFISCFKSIRNKVNHSVRVSSRVDAERMFKTTKRFILVIAKKKLMQNW